MRLLPLALVLLAATASAQDQPIVRITLTPEEVNVGEAAEMQVTVFVPTWFAKPPVFPTFEVANAVTRLPPDSSYPMSQRIGRDTWSGIVRNYKIYPLSASVFELGGNSLIATRIISRFRDRTQFDISLSQFFENATIRQITARIRDTRPGTASSGIPRLNRRAG